MNLLVSFRKKFGTYMPSPLRSWFLRHFSVLEKRTEWWISKDPYKDEPPYSTCKTRYPFTVGILKEFWHRHTYLIKACREMGIAYKLIDITASDWIEQIRREKCDLIFCFPSVQTSIWKNMYDERLKYISQITNTPIFPKYEEMYMYESKRRMAYWLEANQINHARTYVFYSRREANDYVTHAQLPIVAKNNMGARAAGIHIYHKRNQAYNYVKKIFGNGIVHADGDSRDADWGCAIFQDYIETPYEWRVIKIGEAFFAHKKLKKGDFCSGSGRVEWANPPVKLLNFVKMVAGKGNIQTADIDIFENNGQYVVNEIQAYWGWIAPYQMLVNGIPGYYQFDTGEAKWKFVEGIFCRNGGSNLRIQEALKSIGINFDFDFGQFHDVVSSEDVKNSQEAFK